MIKLLLKIFVILVLLMPLRVSATPTVLGVQPTQINSATTPGSEISGEIFVENNGEEALRVNSSALDIISTVDGTTYGLLNENDPYSIARWITLLSPNFEIKSKSSIKMPYKIKVPFGVRMGDYWSIIFMNLDRGNTGGEKNRINIGERIGVKTFVNVLELKKVKISKVKIKPIFYKFGQIRCQFVVKNLGSVDVQPKGEVSIKTADGKDEGTINFDGGLIRPGEEKEVSVFYEPKKIIAKYNGVVNVKDIQSQKAEFSFIAFPYFLVAIIIIIVILGLRFIPIFVKVYKKNKKKKQIKTSF